MMIIAFFIIVSWGFVSCFSEAKQAWLASRGQMSTSNKSLYILKSLSSLTLALMGLGGLLQAIAGA